MKPRFEVGKEYQTANGSTALVLSVNSPYMQGGTVSCPIVAAIKGKDATYFSQHNVYDVDGNYCGMKVAAYTTHRLISDVPTEEEQKTIDAIKALIADPNNRDADEQMLKVIRSLKK